VKHLMPDRAGQALRRGGLEPVSELRGSTPGASVGWLRAAAFWGETRSVCCFPQYWGAGATCGQVLFMNTNSKRRAGFLQPPFMVVGDFILLNIAFAAAHGIRYELQIGGAVDGIPTISPSPACCLSSWRLASSCCSSSRGGNLQATPGHGHS